MESYSGYSQAAPQKLSGGAKFGYGALGFVLALIGVLIAWLVNKDKSPEVKKSAIISSVVGCVISIVMWIVLYAVVFAGMMATYSTYL